MEDKADQLAQEMSRFEQEIMNAAPHKTAHPGMPPNTGPPGPPPGPPPQSQLPSSGPPGPAPGYGGRPVSSGQPLQPVGQSSGNPSRPPHQVGPPRPPGILMRPPPELTRPGLQSHLGRLPPGPPPGMPRGHFGGPARQVGPPGIRGPPGPPQGLPPGPPQGRPPGPPQGHPPSFNSQGGGPPGPPPGRPPGPPQGSVPTSRPGPPQGPGPTSRPRPPFPPQGPRPLLGMFSRPVLGSSQGGPPGPPQGGPPRPPQGGPPGPPQGGPPRPPQGGPPGPPHGGPPRPPQGGPPGPRPPPSGPPGHSREEPPSGPHSGTEGPSRSQGESVFNGQGFRPLDSASHPHPPVLDMFDESPIEEFSLPPPQQMKPRMNLIPPRPILPTPTPAHARVPEMPVQPSFPSVPLVQQMMSVPAAPVLLPLPVPSVPTGAEAIAEAEAAVSTKPLKQMKMKRDPKKLRKGGGKVWEDPSLDDWIKDDFRIFVGDLGNDVNDDTLARAFSKYSSFLKAKVIRDKFTKKTKGFGFVSFKSPQDFMQAMKEMNGKYIGNRPVKLRKSTWKDRCFEVVKKKEKEKKRLGFK